MESDDGEEEVRKPHTRSVYGFHISSWDGGSRGQQRKSKEKDVLHFVAGVVGVLRSEPLVWAL